MYVMQVGGEGDFDSLCLSGFKYCMEAEIPWSMGFQCKVKNLWDRKRGAIIRSYETVTRENRDGSHL